MSPGDRLREVRQKLGVGVRQLAELAGVPHSSISNFETGKRAGAQFDTVAAVAAKLKISLDWLATGQGESGAQVPADTPVDRARAAAAALGYQDAAIDAGLTRAQASDSAWTILSLIKGEAEQPAPDGGFGQTKATPYAGNDATHSATSPADPPVVEVVPATKKAAK